MPKYDSPYLHHLIEELAAATSIDEKDEIWLKVETPIIEDAPNQSDCLVTFLYREESDKKTIYLWSTFTGLPCSLQSQFKAIPNTDIRYLTLTLPRTFRSAYNVIIVDEDTAKEEFPEQKNTGSFYPIPTGKFKESQMLLMHLFNQGCVQIDPRNKQEMTYYIDYDNPGEFFGKESIIELPNAPAFIISCSLDKAKEHREQCKKEHRFFEFELNFLESSLKNVPGYYENPEQAKRKYWVYLPSDYDKHATPYPLILFLDGSDYLNPMPAPLILDKLIQEGSIPPCVGVFLEYSNIHRMHEYNCNDKFTSFLADDFIRMLHDKNQLNITQDARLITLVGQSASGLAAFYAALTNPTVFGNAIALSPSLEMQKLTDLEHKIAKYHKENPETQFIFDVGTYETIPVDLEFKDGSTQSISTFEANRRIADIIQKKGILIHKPEFIGGHNYGCWCANLPVHIKNIFQHRKEAIPSQQNSNQL
ncbi:TPA: alpha/beta hydrolase [Legionella pneumophila]